MRKSFLALFLLLAALAPAAEARTRFSAAACSLPEPAFDHEAEPDSGIDLGDLYSRELWPAGGSVEEGGEGEEDSGEEEEEGSSEPEAGFSASFEPVVQLEWESEREVVNLTEHPRARGKRLVFGDFRGGFQVTDSRSLTVGLGGQVSFSFGNTTFLGEAAWANVGILPVVGREAYSYRFVPTRQEAESRSRTPQLEEALSALPSLREGDMLAYDTQGGIVFWGGLGAGSAGLTAAVLARGDFQIQIEKVAAGQVHVKITESRVRSLALQAGASLVSSSVSQYARHARGFGFLIRYGHPLGAAAFHDLVRGNIAPVQKLARSAGVVVKESDWTSLDRRGRSRQVFVGLPFLLNFSYGKDRFVEWHRQLLLGCGRRIEAVYGAFFRRRQFRAFRHEEQDTIAFYGASYAIRGLRAKRPLARGFFGELLLKYSASHASPFRLSRAMEKLAERTGLPAEVRLALPESRADMLYSSLSLRARFGAGHTRNILRRAPLLPAGDDPATAAAFARMRVAAAELAAALRRSDEQAATSAYARFGEAMLTNAASFRAGLALAGKGARLDYTVEGSDFSLYTDTLQTADDRGRLAAARRPLLSQRRAKR